MNHITQPPKSILCGQCCLAMAAGVTLDRAIGAVGHHKGTNTKSILRAGRFLGLVFSGTRLKPVKSAPKTGTWICKHRNGRSRGWHWVLWVNGVAYDPSSQLVGNIAAGVKDVPSSGLRIWRKDS